ncbi:MAG: 4Fe-4S dicluster domain-containing protein [Elusimicrobiota bacterium]|jgi:ferredoxin
MTVRIRLLSQALFLAFSLYVFFGGGVPRPAAAFYHALHVFPTLSALPWVMLPPGGVAALAVVAGLLLVTFLAGRLYCSYLCPVGFFQDLARRAARALGWGARPAPARIGLRLGVLAAAAAFMLLRSSAYNYLDHFSNLGRVYGLAHALHVGGPFGWDFALGLIFLLMIVLLPLRWPRWFCATLCPSGTLFMLIRKLAPSGIWAAGAAPRPEESDSGRMSRQELLGAAAGAVLGAGAAAGIKARLLKPVPDGVIPPGGRAREQFYERCLACDACVAVCPTQVLVPAGMQGGLAGAGKARLDYDRSYCAYECNACLSVCPSGALSYFPVETKKLLRLGNAVLRRESCIPYCRQRDCGACQEVCPTGAIVMEPFRATFGPVLRPDYCIGCGACQFACPARPRKAIFVEPAPAQSFAFTPQGGSGRARPAAEGFPF